MLKFDSPMWPHPTPEEEDFKRYLSINYINKDVIINQHSNVALTYTQES